MNVEHHNIVKSPQRNLNDLLDLAAENTPSEDPAPIEKLWQFDIKLPKIRDIITNPAIRPSKKITIIKPEASGRMAEYIDIDGVDYDVDKDLIQWTVKGRGTAKHEDGLLSGVVASERADYVKGIRRHCNRPDCPICASYHNRKDTPAQTDKIMAKSKQLRHTSGGWRAGKLQHLTISPPEGDHLTYLTPEGLRNGSKMAQKLATISGLMGAGYVFHPFRQDGVNDLDELPEEYTPSGTNSGDKMQARFSPHFHFIGFGFIDPEKVKEIYARTGWIIKALRTGKKSITKPEEITAVLSYVKSHAGVISEASPYQPDRQPQTINWMGGLGPNAHGKVATLRIHTPQLSPIDGGRLDLYHVHGKNNDLTKLGPYERLTDINIYCARGERDRLRAFIRDHAGYPEEILQYLDRHPDKGACALTHRQLSGLLTPRTMQAEDGTIHCYQSDCTVKLHLKKGTTSGTGPADMSGQASVHLDGQHCNESPPPEVPHGIITPPTNPAVPDLGIIDYHLPPEVII